MASGVASCPACAATVVLGSDPLRCGGCGRRIAGASDEQLLVLRTEADDHRLVAVAAVGDIDIRSAPLLQAALDAAVASSPTRIEIGLAGVRFIDARGVALLARTARRAGAATTVLRAPSPTLLRMLEVTALLDTFVVEPAPT